MTESENKYLVYRIDSELYATDLLDVREVLEYQKPKFMPNMKSFFSGVINVRGMVVGVIDLREKFGVPVKTNAKTAMLLCDTAQGVIAAVVDQVESVTEFKKEDIGVNKAVQSRVQIEYMVGIVHWNKQLITVLNLQNSLNEENYKAG